MLQLKNIHKQYKTGSLVQKALDNVSLTLRDNEFVAILGPSGSGKTTLLNIIGGLDRYDSGDLIINSISTKKYKDRDWDSYRNHTIGFVFQSYNLIGHQSILSNVELALTISGVRRRERKRRAKEALRQVGLGDHIHKRPNQLSGGQMQRVAIARALVNDPDILLADEPTGALDSETSVQVMDLLQDVSKDRLVVMVTHNPELAHDYATRIIELKDGVITSDSMPETPQSNQVLQHKNLGKASMSFWTSLMLSFNNLRTKKARTLLTSFAGSIGIIGIALILALSTGVNEYITTLQEDTMTSYPIQIDAETMDLSSFMNIQYTDKKNHKKDGVYSNNLELEANVTTNNVTTNNLKKFKQYIDTKDNPIQANARKNGIVYSYDTKFGLYTYDNEGTFVNADGSTLDASSQTMYRMQNQSIVQELMNESIVKKNYDLVYGDWAKEYNEVVLVLDQNHEISTKTLYQLGMLPTSEYKNYMEQSKEGEHITLKDRTWTYEELCNQELVVIPKSELYVKQANDHYASIEEDTAQIQEKMKDGIPLKIVGVIAQNDTNDTALLNTGIGYTSKLTDYIIERTDTSAVVQAQKQDKTVNVLNGLSFETKDDAQKIEETKTYLSSLEISQKADMMRKLMAGTDTSTLALGESELAAMLDQYLENPDQESLLNFYSTYLSSSSYKENLANFGVIDKDAPSSIRIYTDSFESKEAISTAIDAYNNKAKEADKITYTDYVGLLMSSVTTMVNVITYVLIAFVAVSLVVSSIMIGIITYISVLERTKEIGILRAIGASKKNISRIFNAETFIIGLFSGLIGVGLSSLLCIPANRVIEIVTNGTQVNAHVPVTSAIILIFLATLLTMIGGWIPSKKASKQDPVKALRSE